MTLKYAAMGGQPLITTIKIRNASKNNLEPIIANLFTKNVALFCELDQKNQILTKNMFCIFFQRSLNYIIVVQSAQHNGAFPAKRLALIDLELFFDAYLI